MSEFVNMLRIRKSIQSNISIVDYGFVSFFFSFDFFLSYEQIKYVILLNSNREQIRVFHMNKALDCQSRSIISSFRKKSKLIENILSVENYHKKPRKMFCLFCFLIHHFSYIQLKENVTYEHIHNQIFCSSFFFIIRKKNKRNSFCSPITNVNGNCRSFFILTQSY